MRDLLYIMETEIHGEQNPLTTQTCPKNVGYIESNEAKAMAILTGFTSLIHRLFKLI